MKLRHNFDVYDNAVLLLARDAHEWKRMRKQVPSLAPDVPGSLGEVGHHAWVPNDGMDGPINFFPVWIDVARHSTPELLANTCGHEAFHMAGSLMEELGGKLDSGEPMAYLVGFVTGWLYKRCAPRLVR